MGRIEEKLVIEKIGENIAELTSNLETKTNQIVSKIERKLDNVKNSINDTLSSSDITYEIQSISYELDDIKSMIGSMSYTLAQVGDNVNDFDISDLESKLDDIRVHFQFSLELQAYILHSTIFGKLFKQEDTFEAGYGNFENGAGLVANEIFMPGVTAEMMQWWFAWHPLEPLRYTIWDPKDHHSVAISDDDRAKILNPGVPLEEKSRGVVHWVVESLGGDADDCIIHFMNPLELGFAPEDFHEPNITGAIGGWAELHGRKAPMDSFAVMIHTYRETEEGLWFRSRFWMGYKYIRGQVVCVLPEGVVIPDFVMKGLLNHSIEEYTNLAAILPGLYAECEGKVE